MLRPLFENPRPRPRSNMQEIETEINTSKQEFETFCKGCQDFKIE